MNYQLTITLTDKEGGEVTRLYKFEDEIPAGLYIEVEEMKTTLENKHV